jgi:hypothetical protein
MSEFNIRQAQEDAEMSLEEWEQVIETNRQL